MKVIFWLSSLFIIYTYIGYPLFIVIRKMFISNHSRACLSELPKISVVIAAHNAEEYISRRVIDINRQNYPPEKLKIIVVSDGSTDRTVDELSNLSCSNLEIIALPYNQGKAMALNAGIAASVGELVIFCDVRQKFHPDAIRHLSDTFADPDVGCVSGELFFLQDAESAIQAEIGAYWKYEKWVRKKESATGSVVGATGAIYAIRRKLYRPLPQGTLLDDVLTPMNIVAQGYLCLFNSKSIAYDVISKNVSQEWKRKVRTLAGNWQLLSLSPSLLIPWRNPIWWRFLSHKIFRLLVPLALVVNFLAGMLAENILYRIATLLQLLFCAVALIGWLFPATRENRFVNCTYFFIVMNAAAVAGFWKWVTGQCNTTWQPASYTAPPHSQSM